MNRIFSSFILLLLVITGTQLQAQLITANPTFPTDQNQVVITFDASLGSAGLAGYTGDVYAHTGVITDKSNSNSDWKYVVAAWSSNIPKAKMSRIAPDLYTLTLGPSIREYYGVPASDEILKLAFVFRSSGPVNGSYLEGKTAENGDIFYDVYEPGLNVIFVQPDQKLVLAEPQQIIPFSIASIDADSTVLFINNVKVASTTAQQLSYQYTAAATGSVVVKATAYATAAQLSDSVYLFVRPPVVVEALPAGMVDGVNYLGEHSVLISLLAPQKDFAFVIGDFNNWMLDLSNYMKKTPDGLRHWVQLDNLNAGEEYAYQFFVDGELRVADPFSHKILDPWNDSYIPASTYPNLKPYPVGKTNGVVSVFQTNMQPYTWLNESFTAPEPVDLVIYELHIRDFVSSRSIKTVKDTLDYLQRLGVNVVELMPINEFEGNDSWGYNPAFYFATDKAYGTMNDYKAFIDECHSRGMAVVIDMVLNHSYGLSPLVQLYMGSGGQVAANNPWYNVTCPHPPYCWGYDFNHQSTYTQDFVDRVNRFWLEEFKVDGFRFDFTKGFTNTQGDGSQYDASRIAILKRMADKIWEVNNNAYVILEHFAPNTEEKELANYGMMIWGNLVYAYNQSTMGYPADSDFSWISYKKRGWSEPHVVGYMESHDEERQMYKNYKYGNNSNSAHNPRNLNIAVKRNAAAAAMFLLVPGPKMIWQFGELGYDFGINYCPDGTYSDGCRTSAKPVKWDYKQDWNRRLLYNYYSNLIQLRHSHEAFRTADFTMYANAITKSLHLTGQEMSVTVLANFDVTAKSIIPQFQQTGKWYSYFSGDSLEVADVNATILLNPGEFRVYTSKKLTTPEFVGLDEAGTGAVPELNVYPNPAEDQVVIEINQKEMSVGTIELLNAFGQKVSEVYTGILQPGTNHIRLENLRSNPPGMYFIRMDTGSSYVTKKLMIK